ncbi:carbohydrate-binding module family 48 protein [Pleomassaria siparia CBS 279.74]|uniref:Carbohydrate-binding module family 48 protein n=1 Tax=Pleomassaria siparia CBS 279.74 TaxID=1314801 RepID=A0A6G1KQ35_9PLEO|nr:carbohydrate-binding module family 48 protein [Pleomassaria siparia CBS 279.74]
MGNQPSRSNAQSPVTNVDRSASVVSSHGPALPQQHVGPVSSVSSLSSLRPTGSQHSPRRRESIQALSIKAKGAPPVTSLDATIDPTFAHPSPSSSSHRRARSQNSTTAAYPNSTTTSTFTSTLTNSTISTLNSVATQLRAAHDSLRPPNDDTTNMGNEQSRQKGQSQSQSQARVHRHALTTPQDLRPPAAGRPAASPQTRPVDVPATPAIPREEPRAIPHFVEPENASQDYFAPSSQFSRPPRLPLPIEEEVHTPGSPILSPADFASPIFPNDIEGVLPRRTSVLSSTTADDDDLGEEFKGPQGQPTVPTLIEWEAPGERVYVTGTFAGWNRKYKLHRNGPSKKNNVLSAWVNIAPGTHHLKFIVDGDMTTSDKLPTAVDYTNILVNYLEVSVDDIPQPGADVEAKPVKEIPVEDQHKPDGFHPPQILPVEPEPAPPPVPVPEIQKAQIPVSAPSPKKYHDSIPRYLLDLDAPEESSRMARASAAVSGLATPPTLPMFLSKSILNGTTPMKDDSSVLIMPNHTVLNHLATSSIKDDILATSGTTRYKQKFLTTIMYKPKNEH